MVVVTDQDDIDVSLREYFANTNPVANLTPCEASQDMALAMLDEHVELIDEIYAYSRYVVTQVFPEDDDRIPVTPTCITVKPTKEWQEIVIALPNHKSVDINRLQFWLGLC